MKRFIFTFVAIIIIVAGYFVIKNMPNTSNTSNIPANRLTYSGNGIRFSYPESFGANVWKAVTWPPKVTAVPADEDAIALGCPMLKDSSMITESWGGESDDTHFSFIKWQDIGAGQLYTTTCYLFSWNNMNYVIDFEVHSHSWCEHGNCWAYCGTENEQECRDFNIAKNVDQVIETIISTVKIKTVK